MLPSRTHLVHLLFLPDTCAAFRFRQLGFIVYRYCSFVIIIVQLCYEQDQLVVILMFHEYHRQFLLPIP